MALKKLCPAALPDAVGAAGEQVSGRLDKRPGTGLNALQGQRFCMRQAVRVDSFVLWLSFIASFVVLVAGLPGQTLYNVEDTRAQLNMYIYIYIY